MISNLTKNAELLDKAEKKARLDEIKRLEQR